MSEREVSAEGSAPPTQDQDAAPLQIFLSYRREDAAGHAGRLWDALRLGAPEEPGFSEDQIFMDIDTIEPGVDFRKVIREAVGSSDVVVVLIGRQWLSAVDPKGRPRLDNPADFVRLEIEAALQRDTRVVPVLVQGAEMPGEEQLPESLADFAHRNAMELSDARWGYDVGRLATWLKKLQREKTERTRRERARQEQEAAARAERERAEREAAARAEREQAEREAAARAEREQAEQEAAARAEREQAEREAAARAEREQAERDAAAAQRERAEREQAERDAAAQAKREQAERAMRARAETGQLGREVAEGRGGGAALDVSRRTRWAGNLVRRVATGVRRRRSTAAIVGAAVTLVVALGLAAVLFSDSPDVPKDDSPNTTEEAPPTRGAPLSRVAVPLRQDCENYGYDAWGGWTGKTFFWDFNDPVVEKLCERDIKKEESLWVPLAHFKSSSDVDKLYEALLRDYAVSQPSRRYRTSRTSGRFFIGKRDDQPEQMLVWTDEPGRVIGSASYLVTRRPKPEDLVRDWQRYVLLGNNLTIEHRGASAQ